MEMGVGKVEEPILSFLILLLFSTLTSLSSSVLPPIFGNYKEVQPLEIVGEEEELVIGATVWDSMRVLEGGGKRAHGQDLVKRESEHKFESLEFLRKILFKDL